MKDKIDNAVNFIDDPPIYSGMIIRFTDYNTNDDSFTAVSEHTIKFPYSLLNAFFIKEAGRCVYCCTLRVDGISYQIFQLSAEEFWELVKDKSFKVMVDKDVYLLLGTRSTDFSYEIKAKLLSIFKSKDSGEPIRANNLLSASSCYQFEEIK